MDDRMAARAYRSESYSYPHSWNESIRIAREERMISRAKCNLREIALGRRAGHRARERFGAFGERLSFNRRCDWRVLSYAGDVADDDSSALKKRR